MAAAPDTPIIPAAELGRVHFIGIGGAGMSGIARIMLMRGMTVTGSDAKDSSVVAALRALGAEIAIGQRAENIADVDTVVVSSAIRQDNPELAAARDKGLRIIHRSAALAGLMHGRTTVAIAGTHGKTTTTSMTTVALQAGGGDPSFVIGGVLTASGTNAHDGTGEAFIAEADESDGSFLLYEPAVAVITNAEADHLDHYGDWAGVRQAFVDFASHVRSRGGVLIACADDAGSREIAAQAAAEGTTVVTYGFAETADVPITDLRPGEVGTAFTVTLDGRDLDVELQQPGAYNAANATAALCVVHHLGGDLDAAVTGLAGFGGTRRRFELRGTAHGVRVYDDYAHHPTEVSAVLTAARSVVAPGGRVHAIFQPHLFSRTQNFKEEFGQALGIADEAIVLDVFPAREDPIPGVTGAIVAEEVPHDNATFLPAFSDAVPTVVSRVQPGDIVITIGAGDVTILGPEIVAALETAW
ncbi:UDP-N-acetylmuramate--L-alanine ligase [Brevibacterium luteolum]|uniref:UDP-N-acetylmuramate--L-alanine ligase n=1 Tax=Brevibacterium luteolum TaxID=199591 RepID=A0A6G8KU84_9MICO|nr:UDP-N-acetylmuramate--L-alanine ligase [Brevibacterium luteolum]MBU8577252.1 UDP-N-acetylmuramate--L-alanine ligase [Brevibacterium luteolum]QIN28181.1 UDP-N-acetylmuramate--L-alanine ligase [Brevibacterium luteolum]